MNMGLRNVAWGCKEACSISSSHYCLRNHSLPPHTLPWPHSGRPGQKVQEWRPAWLRCQGRAGLQSESESEFSSERKAERTLGRSSGASGTESRLQGGAVSWNPGLRPPQLMVVSAWCGDYECLGPSRLQQKEAGNPDALPLRLQALPNLPGCSHCRWQPCISALRPPACSRAGCCPRN